jgi:hypothetical protein
VLFIEKTVQKRYNICPVNNEQDEHSHADHKDGSAVISGVLCVSEHPSSIRQALFCHKQGEAKEYSH